VNSLRYLKRSINQLIKALKALRTQWTQIGESLQNEAKGCAATILQKYNKNQLLKS
jgi:hypothetical protein